MLPAPSIAARPSSAPRPSRLSRCQRTSWLMINKTSAARMPMIEYVIPLPLVNPCYSKRATYRAVLALSTKIPIMTSIAHYQVVFLAKSAHRCSLIGDTAQPRLLWSVAIHIQTFQNSGGVRSRLRSYKLHLFQNASSCRPSAPPLSWDGMFGSSAKGKSHGASGAKKLRIRGYPRPTAIPLAALPGFRTAGRARPA